MVASGPDGQGPSRFALRATASRRREAPTLTDLTRQAKARHEIEGEVSYCAKRSQVNHGVN